MNISSTLKSLFTPAQKAPAAPKPKQPSQDELRRAALEKLITMQRDYYQAHPEALKQQHKPGMGDYAFWANPASYHRMADKSFWANPNSYNHGD